MDLRGRIALVTGGGRGIGRSIALALAREGAAVAVLARTRSAVEAVAAEVLTLGSPALAIVGDVTRTEDLEAAFATCGDQLGAPQVLVNNAGIAPSAPFLETSEAEFERVLRVNVTSAFLCTQMALPAMIASRFGRVINVASTAGKTGFRFTTAYTASKHALVGLTRALALEVARDGVTVNAVCPGFVRSDLTREAAEVIAQKTGRTPEAILLELARLSPGQRLLEPSEVAEVVRFLATSAAAGINGQAWNIDAGGVTA